MSEDARHSVELEALERHHALLRLRVQRTRSTDASAVLELGATVLAHRTQQLLLAARILSWLDPAVSARLGEEQDQLGQDLELLRELLESGSESADSVVLAGALLRRLREHLRYDERVLQRPLQHLLALGAPQPSRRGEAS
jgi:hypothetical protein